MTKFSNETVPLLRSRKRSDCISMPIGQESAKGNYCILHPGPGLRPRDMLELQFEGANASCYCLKRAATDNRQCRCRRIRLITRTRTSRCQTLHLHANKRLIMALDLLQQGIESRALLRISGDARARRPAPP